MNKFRFRGKVWVIADNQNHLLPDIDTDQIYHNAHLHITDNQEMGRYAFGNLNGWKDFSQKAKPGDIIIAGSNFGSGSSRQQAVDCFKSLGIQMVIAASYGAIYKRNAINSGFVILTLENIEEIVVQKRIQNLDTIETDLNSNILKNTRTGEQFQFSPFTRVQKDIFEKGTLLNI